MQEDNIPTINKIIASMSISSLLKSENLFDKYLYSTASEKEIMMDQIQKIFDGENKVEDLLDLNEITFDNSQDCKMIKRHINVK